MPVMDTEKCTGCRACELACSYHHQGEFSPSISSVHIKRDDREGRIELCLYKQAEGIHLACDCPTGKEFCLKYCPVIARDELKDILSRRGI
jgi:Fe-S-cluster-containing dehydrogenase component